MTLEQDLCEVCRKPFDKGHFFKYVERVQPNKKYCSPECSWKSDTAKAAGRRNARKARERYPIKFMLKHAKERALKKGLEFNIVEEDINIPEFCPALGIKLNSVSGRIADSSPSLDRIDNTKGYIKGNVAVISCKANRIKTDATKEELEKVAKYLKG